MIRFTRAGSAVTVGAAIAAVAGRLLGLDEILLLAIGALACVAIASLCLAIPSIEAKGFVERPRVSEGDRSAFVVRLTNHGRGTSRLTLTFQLEGKPPVELPLGILRRGEAKEVRFDLPTARRGVVTVDHVTLSRTDPFGLLRRKRGVSTGRARLVVLPRVTRIAPAIGGRGDDPLSATTRKAARSEVGGEFATLRPYEHGDDLRRIHWPTSARKGELVVRREERTLQRSCTVVLDTNESALAGNALEPLVRAAASILAASTLRGDTFRMRTTAGFDSGPGSGDQHLMALLDELAALQPDAAPPGSARGRAASPNAGAVIYLTTPTARPRSTGRLVGPRVVLSIRDDDDFAAQWLALMGPPESPGARDRRLGRAWAGTRRFSA